MPLPLKILIACALAYLPLRFVFSKQPQGEGKRAIFLLLVLVLGALVGSMIPPRIGTYPLPHQVAKYPDGVSLRFAMVHDVIHDRYPRHGKAYYQERNRRILAQFDRQARDADGLPPPQFYPLIDDLGVGYDSLGQSLDAVPWLEKKLLAQRAQGVNGRGFYTTYANLGTFLIHGNMAQARKGNAAARDRVAEGIHLLHQSMEVNPEAHFGREIWQAVAAEFLMATIDKPDLLLKFDLVGNRLDQENLVPRTAAWFGSWESAYEPLSQLKRDPGAVNVASLRGFINKVGADEGWAMLPVSVTVPVPFDEPVLGIVGMWRLGGGANPHFALALAEMMRKVGQYQIAWRAYERAIREAERFSADPQVRGRFVELCKLRQMSLFREDREGFEAELKHGQQYQRAYQQYEEEQIAGGRALDDPAFYAAFEASHPPIASPVGDADYVDIKEPTENLTTALSAGFFCLLGGIYLRWRSSRETTT